MLLLENGTQNAGDYSDRSGGTGDACPYRAESILRTGDACPYKDSLLAPPITNYELRIPNYFRGLGTTCTFNTSVVPLSPVPPAVTTTRSPALT